MTVQGNNNTLYDETHCLQDGYMQNEYWASNFTPTFNSSMLIKDLAYVDRVWGLTSFIIIIFANTFVIVRLWTAWKVQKNQNIPNMLVVCLSVTDLLTGLLCYPLRMASAFGGKWYGGMTSCYFTLFVTTFLMTFSTCIVVLMAVERHLSIKRPYFYGKHCTIKSFLVVASILGIYSLTNAIVHCIERDAMCLYMPKWNLYCFETEYYYKSHDPETAFHIWLIIQNGTFILILLICNFIVWRTIKQMEKNITICCPRNKEEYLRELDMICGKHREFSRFMKVVSAVFLLCLLPSMVSYTMLIKISVALVISFDLVSF